MRISTTASDGYTYDFNQETAAEFLFESAREVAGVLRYHSNDNVPPFGILEIAGISGPLMERCEAARERDNSEFVRQYREQQERFETEPEYADARAERDYEIRAAFGEGEEVVNVFTGRRYTT